MSLRLLRRQVYSLHLDRMDCKNLASRPILFLQIYLTLNIMIPQRIDQCLLKRYESGASVYYATYDDFTAAILEFFRETLPAIGKGSEILLRITSG